MGIVNAFCVRIETLSPKSVDIMKFPEESKWIFYLVFFFDQDILSKSECLNNDIDTYMSYNQIYSRLCLLLQMINFYLYIFIIF